MTAASEATIRPARRVVGTAARRTLVATVRSATAGQRAWPDVVILGAQRAGTTSVWRWLAAHPSFVEPVLGIKGVHYFDLDADRSERWYRAHFPLRSSLERRGGGVTGEASPYYLFHPRVPAHAAATLPTTRFIALLRDPVRRAVSHYHHMRDEGHEPLDTLEAALDAEPARLAAAADRIGTDRSLVDQHHMHHSYVARGRYAEQLERWFAAVGRDRVLVLDAGRMRDDAFTVMADVYDFVGLDPALAPAPAPGVNASRYAAPSEATLRRLRDEFSEPDEQLWDLLGDRWW